MLYPGGCLDLKPTGQQKAEDDVGQDEGISEETVVKERPGGRPGVRCRQQALGLALVTTVVGHIQKEAADEHGPEAVGTPVAPSMAPEVERLPSGRVDPAEGVPPPAFPKNPYPDEDARPEDSQL